VTSVEGVKVGPDVGGSVDEEDEDCNVLVSELKLDVVEVELKNSNTALTLLTSDVDGVAVSTSNEEVDSVAAVLVPESVLLDIAVEAVADDGVD